MFKAFSSFDRHARFLGTWVACTFLLCLSAGCTPAQNHEGTNAQKTASSESEASEPDILGALSPEALRRAYPGRNGGEVCREDEHCDAPLRCLAKECAFPPAMTGNVSADTPRAVIHSKSGEHAYYLELATDLPQQRRGLMHREHMAANFGMLFVYDAPRPQSFWMKNTLIPLDILFIGEDLRIGTIVERATPKSLTARTSKAPAQYVLELVGGESAKKNLREGDRVEFFDLPDAR